MVIVFPYGTCAVCEGGLPGAHRRPSRPRVICDSKACAREAARHGARRVNAIMSARRAAEGPKTTHLCPQCSRDLPFDADHFYVDKRNPDGSPAKLARWCKDCKRAYQRVGRFAAKDLGKRRARHRKLIEAAAKDPELMARIRAERARRTREYRARNPERVRANQRRYREKVKRDPERLRRQRETRRMSYRLRRERDGLPLGQRRRREAERDEKVRAVIPPVPAKPLADALDRRLALLLHEAGTPGHMGTSAEVIAESWGASERSIRAWREGERKTVQFNVADNLLVATGLMPWDVWNDPEVIKLWRID